MKVSLVVASGVHQGKLIPIVGTQFLIGRDPQCQLRPASQAISKQHCAILLRDGQVFVKDFGSTNGTVLNGQVIQSDERPVAHNDSLKIGPLDFTVRIEAQPARPDVTPLPDTSPEALAALAAVKAATAAAPKGPARDTTPAPAKPIAKPNDAKNVVPPAKPPAAQTPPAKPVAAEGDDIAAMLLGMADDDEPVPGGSTVADVPLGGTLEQPAAGQTDEKKDAAKKPATSREDMSNAANEILRRYMRRPK